MRKIKKALSFIMVIAMITSLSACKIKDDPGKDIKINTDNGKYISENIGTSLSGKDFIKNIKTTYASSTEGDVSYLEPIYSVSNNEFFEFEASEEAGYKAYKAFEVWAKPGYEEYRQSFCKCTYENGKIKVVADGAIEIDEKGTHNAEEGNWGSYNKLYLVQLINLNTGEDLVKPFVTPFTIRHDLDAPVIKQTVSDTNTYKISWEPVVGATEYRVYRHFGENNFELEVTTTNTEVLSTEFNRQNRKDTYTDLINQDLGLTNEDKINLFMNNGVKPLDDTDGKYVVIAIDSFGNSSGISNVVNIHDISNMLPYKIDTVDGKITINISKASDLPTYVQVEMLDGSKSNMIINYHGAKASKFEGYSWIQPTVVNTDFSRFIIEITGIEYEDMMESISDVTDRQDSLIVQAPRTNDITQEVFPEAPAINRDEENREIQEIISTEIELVDRNDNSDISDIIETNTDEGIPNANGNTGTDNELSDIPEPVPAPAPETTPNTDGLVVTPDGYTTVDLMLEEAAEVQNRLALFGDSLDKVAFARNDLQSWIASCLIANMDVITIPVSVFPDAANLDYVSTLFAEAYRQNPTSGMITDMGFAFDYESIVVKYAEDTETRLNKATKELESANQIANQLLQGNDSEYDKILALNNYICGIATYDMDSSATDVDMNNMSEAFIDAHTPYGILCNNYGVCESYAESMLLIGRLMGLDIRCVFGTLCGGGHEWNKVKIGDNWYIVDTTNNDSTIISNAFLNVTDKQTEGILAEDKSAMIEELQANDDSYEYYTKHGLIGSNPIEVSDILIKELNSGARKVGVRMTSKFEDTDYSEVAKAIMTKFSTDCYMGAFNGIIIISMDEIK